jgi:hypothetical protein
MNVVVEAVHALPRVIMDVTDKIARSCKLSSWRGDLDKCRRCDRTLTGRSRKYCTKRCSRLFIQNHNFRKARVAARKRARGPCECPRVRSHVKCQHCGTCEGQVKLTKFTMEVNHIIPRNGQSLRGYSCINHVDVLEVLCHACHLIVTRKQRLERKLLS